MLLLLHCALLTPPGRPPLVRRPVHVHRRRLWPFLTCAAIAGGTVGTYALLRAAGRVGGLAGAAAQLGAAVFCTGVGVAGSLVARFVATRTAFRARAFAPVYSGPSWQPLMRAVHAKLCAEARERGFSVVVINEDVRSTFVACLDGLDVKGSSSGSSPPDDARGGGRTTMRSPTSFWQKLPEASAEATVSAPLLQPDAFFDPRDI